MEPEEARCEQCGGPMVPLGWLGPGYFWGRCRNCGWDAPINLVDEEVLDSDEKPC